MGFVRGLLTVAFARLASAPLISDDVRVAGVKVVPVTTAAAVLMPAAIRTFIRLTRLARSVNCRINREVYILTILRASFTLNIQHLLWIEAERVSLTLASEFLVDNTLVLLRITNHTLIG